MHEFNFTHSIAVQEKHPKRFPTLVFQTEEEGMVSIEVVSSLEERVGQRDARKI